MVNYRRHYQKGGSYFFTVTLQDRQSQLLTTEIRLLFESIKEMQKWQPCVIDAMVILPDHIHAIWTLPAGDNVYSIRWKKLKSHFTQSLLRKGYPLTKNHRNEYPVWQKRFWEHTIRDEVDFVHHVNYIHYNPVKHGLVKSVCDWPYSSFHRHVRNGLLPDNWGSGSVACLDRKYGE